MSTGGPVAGSRGGAGRGRGAGARTPIINSPTNRPAHTTPSATSPLSWPAEAASESIGASSGLSLTASSRCFAASVTAEAGSERYLENPRCADQQRHGSCRCAVMTRRCKKQRLLGGWTVAERTDAAAAVLLSSIVDAVAGGAGCEQAVLEKTQPISTI